jgi:glycine cleavage system aminomethyltransferase T
MGMSMATNSLQQKMDSSGGPLPMMRGSRAGPYVFPIPAEYSNWRDEQRAWREGVALMDLSYHMTDLYIEGPDALRLLSELGANTFNGFADGKAKQYVACAPSGYLIGDMILFALADGVMNVVGRPTVANWIQYKAQAGRYDVKIERDERTVDNPRPKRTFRYQVQGPEAWKLLETLHGKPFQPPKFFQQGRITVAGREFRCLRHGMGGAPGLEIFGPREQGPEVKAAILEAGKQFGLRQVGSRAYGTSVVDSGWLPCPLPAIYSGEDMQSYREWLPSDSYEGIASLGGSFDSGNIEEYYFTPWELDYGRVVRFDHDFVGRSALEAIAQRPHRKKVSLVWNAEDVTTLYRSQMTPGRNGKYMEAPVANYASYPYDRVINHRGDTVGVSTYIAFLAPDNAWVSLGVVDEEWSAPGNEVLLIWGEPGTQSHRPPVEKHLQMQLRATVTTWPFSSLAQKSYRP